MTTNNFPAQINNEHAIKRMTGRLSSLLDANDLNKISNVTKQFGGRRGKFYVEIKNFGGRLMHLEDNENDNINGDVIVAVVREGELKTVMLSKSWRKNYFSDGKYIK